MANANQRFDLLDGRLPRAEHVAPIEVCQLASAQAVLENISPFIALVPNVVLAGETHGQRLGDSAFNEIFLGRHRSLVASTIRKVWRFSGKPLPRQPARGHAVDAIAGDGR